MALVEGVVRGDRRGELLSTAKNLLFAISAVRTKLQGTARIKIDKDHELQIDCSAVFGISNIFLPD